MRAPRLSCSVAGPRNVGRRWLWERDGRAGMAMKTRGVLVVLCAWLSSAAVIAQTADPISGTWGSPGMPFLERKFDGKGTVIGAATLRRGGQSIHAPIKTGTFDPPSRVFRLEGAWELPDGATVGYVLEGKVDGDTVTGALIKAS
jgi:hypothetical protein